MRKIVISIFVFLTLIFSQHIFSSDSTPLSESNCEPSSIVAGCVNVISGSFSEVITPVSLVGPDTLSVSYCFNSAPNYDPVSVWQDNFGLEAFVGFKNKVLIFRPTEGFGSQPLLWGNKKVNIPNFKVGHISDHTHFHFEQSQISEGITNCFGGYIGGSTNIKNLQADYDPHSRIMSVYTKEGNCRQYKSKDNNAYDLELFREILPSGNKILYYPKANSNEIEVVCCNSQENCIFSRFQVGKMHNKVSKITTSEGKEITFFYEKFKEEDKYENVTRRFQFREVHAPHSPPVSYTYHTPSKAEFSHEKINGKYFPDNRYLKIEYYVDRKNVVGSSKISLTKNPGWRNKVKQLLAPCGPDAQPISMYQFYYHISHYDGKKNGLTEVRDALNHATNYHYCPEGRITAIEHFDGREPGCYKKHSTERFYWGQKEKGLHGDLVGKALEYPDGKIAHYRHLSYDARHNVTEDRLYGNLSGHCEFSPEVEKDGQPIENGCESYAVKKTYSPDRFDLVIKEEYPNGKVISHEYHPGTNLCVATYKSDGQRIYFREFYQYTDGAILAATITDDGCEIGVDNLAGVTQRQIKKLNIKTTTPYYGLPLDEVDLYLDLATGEEKQLKHEKNNYSSEGWLSSKEIYDANHNHCYTLTWEYNELGKVIRETNALGQVTERKYDANGNMTYEKGPGGFSVEMTYDFMNRLVSRVEIHPDGENVAIHSKHDYLSNLTSVNDPFGHVTEYEYDDHGHTILTKYPDCPDENGRMVSRVLKNSYDVMGNCIESIDFDGKKLTKTYNAYGKPVTITYPDGSQELYCYNLDGSLKWEQAKNGVRTHYTYDVEDRVIAKERYTIDGELLSVTRSNYEGMLLESEEDAKGNLTLYGYDNAGRMTTLQKGNCVSHFEYDSLGRKSKSIDKYDHENSRVTKTSYDFLDRVVEEKIEDTDGTLLKHLSYVYDQAGNKIEERLHNSSEDIVTYWRYDTKGKVIHSTDPCGAVTVYEYDYSYYNQYGQKVLKTITTDPLGYRTVVVHDIRGKEAEHFRLDLQGDILSRSLFKRDINGNLSEREEHVYLEGNHEKILKTRWVYDEMSRVVGMSEAVGTPQERTTCYSYNTSGEKEAVIHSDGLLELYKYDHFGRVERYHASDKSFDYIYSYDANGNILTVIDQITGLETKRTYDVFDQMTSETLANGLVMEFTYDKLGRIASYRLPDKSEVEYQYDALHMREVKRFNQTGNLQYIHHLDSYDLAGNLLEEKFPKGGYAAKYKYDPLNRLRKCEAPGFKEEIPDGGYDPVGNLLERIQKDLAGEVTCHYTYDKMYQLASETGMGTHQYLHDSVFNRRKKDGKDYHVDPLNQLNQAGETLYHYDPRGNRTHKLGSDQEVNYTYDALGRLVEVESADWKEEYTYDSFNRRMSKIRHGTNRYGKKQVLHHERYFYLGQKEVGAVDAKGQITQFRLLGREKESEIGAAVVVELGSTHLGVVHDHNGNVSLLFDLKDGTPIESYRYTAFGEEKIATQSTDNQDKSAVLNPWRFSSKRVDHSTGLVNFGRRYYDSEVGRWLTPDPLGYDAGPNLYAYVNNSPLTHVDHFGLIGVQTRYHARARVDRTQSYHYHARAQRDYRHAHPCWQGRGFPGLNREQTINWVRKPFKVTEAICRQLPQGFRQVGVAACRVATRTTKDHDDHWPEPHSANFVTGMREFSDKCRVFFVNGILNCRSEAFEAAELLSSLLGGCRVHGTHNGSHGFFNDICECIANKLGIPTRPARLLAQGIREQIKEMGGVEGGGKIILYAHSQGGLIVDCAKRLLTKEERQMVEVQTIGTARFAQKEDWGRAHNYVSTRDAVPMTDCFNYRNACCGKMDNVTFLKGSGFPGIDHLLSGDTYTRQLKDSSSELLNRRDRGDFL